MAQVIVRHAGEHFVHEYATNSDAYAYADECKDRGYRNVFVRPDPEVGMGASLHYPQDTYPYVITRVSESGKTIWVKPVLTVDRSTGHAPDRYDGPFPVWHHIYSPEELQEFVRADAPERLVRKGKNGWGGKRDFSVGQACYHRNYSY